MNGPWTKFQQTAVEEDGPWKKFAEPERSWSDVPGEALSNVPSSAVQFAKNVTYPILHPIDTVKGLYNIGYGLASKAHGALGGTQDPAQKAEDEAHADAVGQFIKDRYGSVDAVKRTLATDPVNAAADAAAVLSGGGAIATRVPGLRTVGKVAKTTAATVDPIRVAGKAANAAGKGVAAVIGTTTGAGSLPFETAYRAGKTGSRVFKDHISGSAPLSEALDMGQDALRSLKRDRSAAYDSGMAGVRNSTDVLNFEPVVEATRNALNDISYKGFAKSGAASEVYNKIRDMVVHFRSLPPDEFHTAQGLDAFKQAVGEIRMQTKPGTMEHRLAGNIYNAIKTEIVKQAPDYSKAMKDYSAASDSIDEMTRTLSLGERASKDTAMRKLTSVMRNNVNTNYGHRAKLVDELAKKQPELPNAIAGQALNSLAPRGGFAALPAIGGGVAAAYTMNPAAIAMMPLASPRIMGEAAYYMGRGANALSNLSRFTPPAGYRNALYAAGLLSQNADYPND